MDTILKETATMQQRTARETAKGFTMLETLIALVVLAIGILGLAAMLADSLAYMQGSQMDFIAQQKAEQAVEAIFTAKYTSTVTWPQIANFSALTPGGLFLSGPLPLSQPGPDGLFGSVNDVGAPPDFILDPGPDGRLGTADDIQRPLSNFTRTIAINGIAGNNNLRNITVTVNYTTGRFTRSYTLRTLISAFN
jgi:prepilin-type N-terminal cleavage/methylation domain-containing protein